MAVGGGVGSGAGLGMKITYDPEADALYIQLRHAAAKDSVEIEEGVVADMDKEGHIVGLEVLDALARIGREGLANISYENLILSPVPADSPS